MEHLSEFYDRLTPELEKRLYWLIQCDGSLWLSKTCVNARAEFTQSVEQEDFVDFVQDTFAQVTTCRRNTWQDERTGKDVYKLQTRVHPYFTQLYYEIYREKYKGISERSYQFLDAEALALAIMSDGSLDIKANTLYLELNRLSLEDITRVADELYAADLGEWNVNRTSSKYYRLRLRKADFDWVVDQIKPFILPSFRYKIGK